MSKTMIIVISDNQELVEQAKSQVSQLGANVHSYTNQQWRDGIENSSFRSLISVGTPSANASQISFGINGDQRSNVLPFPSATSANGTSAVDGKVATMNEMESKAIENAIAQFKGNLTEAAKALGIGRATLYRKVKQYHIDPTFARKGKKAA